MSGVAVVEVTRGEVVESVHHAAIAVVEATADGPRHVAGCGQPHQPVHLRSAWKPIQAMATYECGLRERFGIEPGDPELAIMSASHHGTDAQRGMVLRLLARAGLNASHLQNGPHTPPSAEGQVVERALGGPQRVLGNCSGKHAGMLAACVARGWDIATYLERDHPLTHHVRGRLAWLMGIAEGHVAFGVDGCRLPTWAAPLWSGAYAFARLAAEPSDLTPAALAAVGLSMRQHPGLLGDPAGFWIDLVRQRPDLLGKAGAEGVFCLTVPDRHLGLAVKIGDGNARALPPLLVATLRQLDVLDDAQVAALHVYAEPVVRNLGGEAAGLLRAVVSLEAGT